MGKAAGAEQPGKTGPTGRKPLRQAKNKFLPCRRVTPQEVFARLLFLPIVFSIKIQGET
jgi:hypothetical protein